MRISLGKIQKKQTQLNILDTPKMASFAESIDLTDKDSHDDSVFSLKMDNLMVEQNFQQVLADTPAVPRPPSSRRFSKFH